MKKTHLHRPWLITLAVAIAFCVSALAAPDRSVALASDERPASDLVSIETSLQKVMDRSLDATVGLRVIGRRGRPSGSGTGVIVSADGLILTVGHIFERDGQEFTIVFNDGHEARGEALGKNGAGDYGLIRITDPADKQWPHVEMADSSKVVVDQLCFMAGHPDGIRPDNQAVVRFGSVLGTTNDWIRTTCIIMPGDSGGPLFNMDGEVVGINSWIGTRSTQNYSVPVNRPRDDWERLLEGEVWGRANWRRGAAGDIPGRRRNRGQQTIDEGGARPDVIPGGVKPALVRAADSAIDVAGTDSIVTIKSKRNGDQRSVLGVIVDHDGHVLTKASELGDHPECVFANGGTHRCKVASIDSDTDLALLRLIDPVDAVTPVQWHHDTPWQAGQMVVSPGLDRDVVGVGVIGAKPRSIPPSGSGFLGVVLDRESDTDGALIDEVMEDSAALSVGLRDGDIVVSVDGDEIDSANDLIRKLRRHNAGDVLWLEVHRPERDTDAPQAITTMSVRVRLNGRPLTLSGRGNHAADRTPVSGRRGNFPKAVRHDTLLRPHECGGPILDSNGRAVGINIARLNRTGSLALPADVVREALDRLYKGAVVTPE